MSKGHGRIQTAILEACAALDEGERHYIGSVAKHIYGDMPTPAQRESIRRAANKLADEGLLELTYDGGWAGTRMTTKTYGPGGYARCPQSYPTPMECLYCDQGHQPSRGTHSFDKWTTFDVKVGIGARFLLMRLSP